MEDNDTSDEMFENQEEKPKSPEITRIEMPGNRFSSPMLDFNESIKPSAILSGGYTPNHTPPPEGNPARRLSTFLPVPGSESVNKHSNVSEDSEGKTNDDKIEEVMKKISFLNELRYFPEFSSILTHTYWGPMTQNSTTLDIIAVYLKGQKMLYIDAKSYCESKLNVLMMPTIFLTAVCTVISVVLKDYNFGPILLSSLTGLSTFILSLISYLKLDAKAQAHKTSAYQFDKLQTMCEFFSGKVLLIKDKDVSANVQKFVVSVEKKVEEIKDTNQFIIPETVRYRYPIIYSINVFSEIKKYKIEEKILKSELFEVCRKIDSFEKDKSERSSLDILHKEKESILKKILEKRNQTFSVDKQFNDEINAHGRRQTSCCSMRGCCSF